MSTHKAVIIECDCGILEEIPGSHSISQTYVNRNYGKICYDCSENIRLHKVEVEVEKDNNPIPLTEVGL